AQRGARDTDRHGDYPVRVVVEAHVDPGVDVDLLWQFVIDDALLAVLRRDRVITLVDRDPDMPPVERLERTVHRLGQRIRRTARNDGHEHVTLRTAHGRDAERQAGDLVDAGVCDDRRAGQAGLAFGALRRGLVVDPLARRALDAALGAGDDT